MKKKLLILLAVLSVFIVGAVRRAQSAKLVTAHITWQVAEACTSADAEATALAVGERTFQTVLDIIIAAGDRTTGDGEIEYFIVPDDWNQVKFTAIGITNDGTYTVDVYSGSLGIGPKNTDSLPKAAARNDDTNLTHIGELAFIIGQQVSTTSGYEMAQSVTATAKDSSASWSTAGTVDSDRTCEARIDLLGDNLLVFVPKTCSANSKLLVDAY